MADRPLLLQLLITARDDATAVFSKLFSFLDRTTSATANLLREQFVNLFGGGIESAANFEQQMLAVAAKGGYTAAELEKLRQAADQIGAAFGVNSLEAAKGMEILAAAGLKVEDIISTLPKVMALARLEGISLDAAATKLADSLSVMGLGFEHAGRMADVLAQGANITLSSATQLADALTGVGGAAKSYGLSLEQTVAVLDLLHKNGIKGAMAGTALSAVLMQLLNPASKASAAIAGLGGNAADFESVLRVLTPQTELTKSAILTFGETAIPALFALRQEGVAGMTEFTQSLKNAAGAAQTATDTMSGGLNNALTALSAAWDAIKKNLLTPLLEPLTQQATRLTSQLNDLAGSQGIRQFGEVIAASAQTALNWLNRLAKEGLAAIQQFSGGLDLQGIAQKVTDAKDNIVALLGAGLDTAAAKFREVAAGMVQTTTRLVVDIKTGLIGLLDAIRQLPIVQGEAFDRLSASIKSLRQGLPELAAVAKAAAAQSARAQLDYNAALERTQQAYQDLEAGAGAYERSVREGAAHMGLSEQEYIRYLQQHGVELQKLIPIELNRFQAVTQVQAELLQQTEQQKKVDLETVDIEKILQAAGVDDLEIKRQQALAAGDFTGALKIEAEQRKATGDAIEKNTQATQADSAAQQENIKVVDTSRQALQRTNAIIADTRKQMEALSETTKRFYDVQFTLALQQAGMEGAFEANRQAMANFNADLSASSEKLADYAEAFNKAVDLEQQGLERMAFAMNGFAKIDAAVEIASGRAQQAYYQQAAAAEQLRVSIETMSVSNVTAATQLNQAARMAESGFKFLDEEDLSGLRQSIADASNRMRELQEETKSAQERLLALNAEIAAERGDTATSERLKLQLEQQQALADLEIKLAEARTANNNELIRLYEEQERKLQTLYTLKEKNLEQDLKQKQQQETTETTTSTIRTTPKASGGISTGKTFTLNLVGVNGKNLTAQTQTDPSTFLDELIRAKTRSLA